MISSQSLRTSLIRNFSSLHGFKISINGYSDPMRIFAKILMSVFGYLRNQGYISVIFVDDPICRKTLNKSV